MYKFKGPISSLKEIKKGARIIRTPSTKASFSIN